MSGVKDLIIGQASNTTWEKVEPFAVSTVWSGFEGHKVLFVGNMPQDARDNLRELGFELIEIPKELPYQDNKFYAYVGRFLLIYQYLFEHPGYRFVFTADTRDLIFQRNPSTWMEKNLPWDKKLVAASEFCRHIDSPPNMMWVNGMLKDISPWFAPKTIYCSGFIAGRAEYMQDLCMAIYLYARHFTGAFWGTDQPIYNTLMHQKAYADITLVPKGEDFFCANCVNLAHGGLVKVLHDHPPIRPFYDFNPRHTTNQNLLWNDGIPNLSEFMALHQYDRIPPLQENIQNVFTLENLRAGNRPFFLELTKF